MQSKSPKMPTRALSHIHYWRWISSMVSAMQILHFHRYTPKSIHHKSKYRKNPLGLFQYRNLWQCRSDVWWSVGGFAEAWPLKHESMYVKYSIMQSRRKLRPAQTSRQGWGKVLFGEVSLPFINPQFKLSSKPPMMMIRNSCTLSDIGCDILLPAIYRQSRSNVRNKYAAVFHGWWWLWLRLVTSTCVSPNTIHNLLAAFGVLQKEGVEWRHGAKQ